MAGYKDVTKILFLVDVIFCVVATVCVYAQDEKVLVRLVNGGTPYEGRVEVYYKCVWGTICSTGWSINEANIICRQLGSPGATTVWSDARFGQGSGPILLGNIACNGNESSIDQCDHRGWFISHYCTQEDVGVTCYVQTSHFVFIRLVNGSTPYEGRVEVYSQDEWGTVCGDSWTIQEANVICRQLGYPSASRVWQDAHFGEGSGRVLLNNVTCNGNESRIDNCSYTQLSNCSQSGVGVTCRDELAMTTSAPVSVRLVNGDTPNEGRVEVLYKCFWGTVCSNGWSIKDAHVICRQLGYPSASRAWKSTQFGEGTGLILLSDVACNGNESSIDQCSHRRWFNYNCYYANVGVTCDLTSPPPVTIRLVNGDTANEGRVELLYGGRWGTVCGNVGWSSKDANVVCRQLGYPSAFHQVWYRAHFGQGSGPIFLRDVACNGDESNIDQCDFSGWFTQPFSIGHYDDAGVTCTELASRVRLVNGNTPFEGRVEVYYKCVWGTITAYVWSINEANVICRQLGFPSASNAWGSAQFGEGSGPILLQAVACNGDESSIDQCDHRGWSDYSRHFYDVGVTCNISPAAPFYIRLVNGSTPYEGRVEVYSQDEWGTVCGDSWTIQEANVICRQLGYPSASRVWQDAHFGEGSGRVLLNNVTCTGNESRIDECSFTTLSNCSQSGVVVTCGDELVMTTSAPVSVRLVNGNTPNEGTVEVFYKCFWGSVCSNDWSIKEAHVICRQLGYPSASQTSIYHDERMHRILLSDVACNGNESSIDQCSHRGWFNHDYCDSYSNFGVTCDLTTPPPVLVRLVNGNTPYEGRVEVYYKCVWGTISGSGWSINEANVICQQLGFPSASNAWSSAQFGEGSRLIVLQDVVCNGDESSIDQCDYRNWRDYYHFYGHFYDVGVMCNIGLSPAASFYIRLVNGSTPYEGRVEVYSQDEWGIVCGDSWTIQEANVICRQLGYPSASRVWQDAHFGEGSGRVLLNNVTCNGNESRIDNCSYTQLSNCSQSDVGVTCRDELAMTTSAPVSVRLVNGDTPNEGRVEVLYKCIWGTICSSSWSIKEAHVVCRQLGYPNASQYWQLGRFGAGTGPKLLSVSACNGNESSIDQCSHGWFTTYNYCFLYSNVGVTCDLTTPPSGYCKAETTNDGDLGTLTWPKTITGQTAVSLERCPVDTTNAGLPKAERNCSKEDAHVYSQWEDHQPLTCGEVKTNITIQDVADVPITTGNVAEIAEFLANETSTLSNSQADVTIEDISTILQKIVNTSSGDTEVTKAVVKVVSNLIAAYDPNEESSDNSISSSAIIQSLETQVSLTLRQEGAISIQQETIHVEAVTLDPSLVNNGLTFASVLDQTGMLQPQEGTLDGTSIRTLVNGTNIEDEDVLASIQLPGNIAKFLQRDDGSNLTQLQASFVVYADDALFSSWLIRNSSVDNSSRLEIAGSVVSLTVENAKLVNLVEPIRLAFKVIHKTESNTYQCVSWDFQLEDGVGDWSAEGCELAGSTNNRVTCDCNHATNFAVLVDIRGQKHVDPVAKRALDIISQVGCALSIVALCITLTIHLSIRKLRSGKSRQIFLHFCVSLLLLYIVFLAGIDNAIGTGGWCVFVASLLHYLALTTMMWMAVEARNMYVSTVKVFPEDTSRYMLKACIVAWGSPLIVLAITLATAISYYNNEHYCFISPGLAMYLGLLTPIGIILLHNIITFILVMRSLLKVQEASRTEQISKRLQNAIGISALIGLTWCFGFLAIDSATFTFQLIFTLANSLQGLIICIMFCFRREEVRVAVVTHLRRACCRHMFSLPSLSAGVSTNLEMSASQTSPSSAQTSNFDLSVSAPQ